MGIVDEDVVRVREASDMVAVVSEHVQLKRVGTSWTGLCPFHSEKSGSLSVSAEKGVYYCFGCGAKGDVITFVREIEHLDFVGAVEVLAAKAGITLRYSDRDEGEGRKQRARLIDAMSRAVEWYHERLLSAPDAAKARGYLRERGLAGEQVRAYQIGWAPEGWDELARALKLPPEVLTGAGLGFINSRGRQTDAFRGRVLFPIFDVAGDPVAFGGRVMPGGDGPKYKNTSETSLYAKSKVLYGLNWAKGAIVAADEAIVCEGYTDVIGFADAGLGRAVATCGTALTEDHFRTLKSFAHRVVLAFDADAAGQNAAARFYEWERAYEIDVAVAALPTGVDPADLARSDPEALAAAVAEATPFLGFRLDRVLNQASLATPEGRARAAEAAIGVIGEHPNPLVRDQYLMQVASRCRIPIEQLRSGTFATAAGRSDRSAGSTHGDGGRQGSVAAGRATTRPRRRRDSPEVEALRLLVTDPDLIAGLLDECLFADEVNLEAYRAMAGAASLHEAVAATDEAAADLLARLAVEQTEADPTEVRARLVEEAALREHAMMQIELGTADEHVVIDRAAEMGWIKLRVEELHDPASSAAAVDQLLAWLHDARRRSNDGE
jgi:DNA primase